MGKKSWRNKNSSKRLDRIEAKQTESDIEISEDDLELLNEYKNTAFLQNLSVEIPRLEKRRKREVEQTMVFENVPRDMMVEADDLLPIHKNGKFIQVKGTVIKENINIDERQVLDSQKTTEINQENDKVVKTEPIPQKEVLVEEKKPKDSITQVMEKLGGHANALIEDPEMNIQQLASLRAYSKDKRPQVISLTMLTQLAVYRDIIPGYRIRKISEKESEISNISKDVRRLRNYEENLLRNYQIYLQSLEDLAQDQMKTGGNIEMLKVSVTCLTSLLESALHFNFRINLITAIVSKMMSKSFPEIAQLCSDAIGNMFSSDDHGEATYETVKILADMLKVGKFDVLPSCLEPLLNLRLTQASKTYDPRSKPKIKKRKQDVDHVSKKMRKINSYRQEVDAEMKEAEAVYDKDEKLKLQSETLKILFVIYFRILKSPENSLLLPKVLEGLARFAHLINVEFFEDLLNVLKTISATQHREYSDGAITNTNSPVCALHCIIAAFELLEAMGNSLRVDLRDLFCALYTQMLRLTSRPYISDLLPTQKKTNDSRNEIQLLLSGFEIMLKKKRDVHII